MSILTRVENRKERNSSIDANIDIVNIDSVDTILETNPCEHTPCQHQSTCIIQLNHESRCICRAHYTGKYCENPRMYA
jgi:hypothetical protein